MKNYHLISLAAAAIVLYACNSSTQEEWPTGFAEEHNARTSLDWSGTYSGVLPCADCEGVDTEIEIDEELHYTLITTYLGKKENTSDTLRGTFTWEGNTIILSNIPTGERPNTFKVEENRLRQLSLDGHEIQGQMASQYLLVKQGNPAVEDKKWQLIELNGKTVAGNIETHYMIFHRNDKRIEAKANCNTLLIGYKITNDWNLATQLGISTLMSCEDRLEDELKEAITAAKSISLDENVLTLINGKSESIARFSLKN